MKGQFNHKEDEEADNQGDMEGDADPDDEPEEEQDENQGNADNPDEPKKILLEWVTHPEIYNEDKFKLYVD